MLLWPAPAVACIDVEAASACVAAVACIANGDEGASASASAVAGTADGAALAGGGAAGSLRCLLAGASLCSSRQCCRLYAS